MIDLKVPFYENTDDTHCYQACLKMALKFFEPTKDFNFAKLDEITAKEAGKPTWPMAGLCWLADNGYDVVEIEKFDYKKFLKNGREYLKEEFGEVVENYGNDTDVKSAQKWTTEFLNRCTPQNKKPSLGDITRLLDDGFIVIAQVNWCRLHDKSGYAGHKILIKGYNDDSLIVHDPGLPGREDLVLAYAQYINASEEASEISAFKKLTNN